MNYKIYNEIRQKLGFFIHTYPQQIPPENAPLVGLIYEEPDVFRRFICFFREGKFYYNHNQEEIKCDLLEWMPAPVPVRRYRKPEKNAAACPNMDYAAEREGVKN